MKPLLRSELSSAANRILIGFTAQKIDQKCLLFEWQSAVLQCVTAENEGTQNKELCFDGRSGIRDVQVSCFLGTQMATTWTTEGGWRGPFCYSS